MFPPSPPPMPPWPGGALPQPGEAPNQGAQQVDPRLLQQFGLQAPAQFGQQHPPFGLLAPAQFGQQPPQAAAPVAPVAPVQSIASPALPAGCKGRSYWR